mgnify:CR=1 FL=1
MNVEIVDGELYVVPSESEEDGVDFEIEEFTGGEYLPGYRHALPTRDADWRGYNPRFSVLAGARFSLRVGAHVSVELTLQHIGVGNTEYDASYDRKDYQRADSLEALYRDTRVSGSERLRETKDELIDNATLCPAHRVATAFRQRMVAAQTVTT